MAIRRTIRDARAMLKKIAAELGLDYNQYCSTKVTRPTLCLESGYNKYRAALIAPTTRPVPKWHGGYDYELLSIPLTGGEMYWHLRSVWEFINKMRLRPEGYLVAHTLG